MSDRFIRRAIELAVHAGTAGNRPFGAVIVAADGSLLAKGENDATSRNDVTAHAELVALRRAQSDGRAAALTGATVYASGEPCPMCAAALVRAGVGRIVFAASTAAFASVLPGGPQFDIGCAELISRCNAGIAVDGPIHEDEAITAMRSVGLG
ncbi:MAG: nucleoside deaminase [Mycolicibacterium cosmeticum]|nr:nucleoside deaminase [Mycolicibacterium cosmeticum]